MLYNIKIEKRNTYHSVELERYTENRMIHLLADLSRDDSIDITISPVKDEEETCECKCVADEGRTADELTDDEKSMLKGMLKDILSDLGEDGE